MTRRAYLWRVVILGLSALVIILCVSATMGGWTWREVWLFNGGLVVGLLACVLMVHWAGKVLPADHWTANRKAYDQFDKSMKDFRASNPHIEGMGE